MLLAQLAAGSGFVMAESAIAEVGDHFYGPDGRVWEVRDRRQNANEFVLAEKGGSKVRSFTDAEFEWLLLMNKWNHLDDVEQEEASISLVFEFDNTKVSKELSYGELQDLWMAVQDHPQIKEEDRIQLFVWLHDLSEGMNPLGG